MASIERRIERLEARHGSQFVAIVDVIGLSEEEAEQRIEAKRRAAEACGYKGHIIVLDE